MQLKEIVLHLIASLLFTANINYSQAQTTGSDDKAISILREFYTEYSTAMDKGGVDDPEPSEKETPKKTTGI